MILELKKWFLQCCKTNAILSEHFRLGGGGGGGAKSQDQSFRNRFSFEKLYLRNERWDGGKSIHCLKALFMIYSKINV